MTELNRTNETPTGAAAADAVAASLLRDVGAWAGVQGELLSGVETLWSEWIRRRREAIDATARSLQRMCECRSVADLARVQQEWLAGAVEWAAGDAAAAVNGAVALTRLAVPREARGETAPNRLPAARAARPPAGRERAESEREAAE